MNNYKTIGIIGGQGPKSTANFYLRIVKYYQDTFGARYVRDFPPMIIHSVPTPDLVESIEDEKITFSMVADAIKKLELGESDFIIIACNSLQYLIEKLQPLIKIPIIGIAPIVANYVQHKGYETVGVLATETTIKKGVYQASFNKMGVKLIIPNKPDQNDIAKVILNVFAGNETTKDTKILQKITENLHNTGVDAVMLACTELPLIIKQSDVSVPLIDCNELYILEAAKRSSNS